MTKKDFVEELKRQQAAGNLKPSQLKRSKSADDLTATHASCQLQIQQLTEQISRIKQETNEQLTSLPQLKEELKAQDKELNELKTEVQEKDQKITELTKELDQSLEKRLTTLKQPLNTEPTEKLTTELKQAKSKIAVLESTLRLRNYHNSWLDSETWSLVISFLVVGLIFYYSTKNHDQKN